MIIRTTCLIGAFAFVTLSPTARAVDPPPDGGYPNENTAEGQDALFSLTDGSDNTASGFEALYNTTTGSENTATGVEALFGNTAGTHNVADGFNALLNNTTGVNNTASGAGALASNSTGGNNTANGFDALLANTTGINNTASGSTALFANSTGSSNAAFGQNALRNNTTGKNNIALGANAGFNLTTGSNNIDIYDRGVAGEANTIRIGRAGTQTATFIAGISGATVAGGVGVIVDTTGHLGTVVSSARFKQQVKPMDKASEAILALQPVTFRYKHELDPAGIPQFGLVAEQVEKVDPDLVAHDEQGKAYTVRYEAVNAMLLNEFLKAHCKIEAQESKLQEQTIRMQIQDRKVQELEATVANLELAFHEQASQLRKVSDEIELTGVAQRVVANKQ